MRRLLLIALGILALRSAAMADSAPPLSSWSQVNGALLVVPGTGSTFTVTCVGGCSGGGSGGGTSSSTFTLVNVATVTFNGVAQPVTVVNFPASQTVSGSVSVTNLSTHTSVDNFPTVQTVAGTVSVNNQSTFTYVNNLSTHTSVDNFPAVQAVSGTFFQSLQPVSLSSADVTGSTVNAVINGAVSVSNTGFNINNSPTVVQSTTGVNSSTVAVVNANGTNLSVTFPSAQSVTATNTGFNVNNSPAVNQAGTWTVQPGNTANTAPWLVVGSTLQVHTGADQLATVGYQANGGSVPVNVLNQVTVGNSQGFTIDIGSGNVTRSEIFDSAGNALNSTGGSLNVEALMQIEGNNGGFPVVGYQTAGASVPVNGPLLTKGTQGTNGFSVQELKDAGRTYVTLVATGVAGVTSEALFSFQQNKAGVVTQNVTSYMITSGKTLRIGGLYCANRDGAAAIAWTRATLRTNTAGATTATSTLIFGIEAGGAGAVVGSVGTTEDTFPDGIEIAGNGTVSIGVTHLDSATTNLVTCTLVGYEY